MRERLPQGGRIDRSRRVAFTFNGRVYDGYHGDTLASALLAHGVRLTARSFKYHRPRGIVGYGVEEPASLVELLGADASGNEPITTVRIRDGLRAKSVNCWPSLRFDIGGVNQLFARVLPAGFYYKTFKWPDWQLFEPMIRRAAGLARAPTQPPANGHYEARHAHADVFIAGAGPAGLMAALVAGRAGKRVFLADEGTEAGGGLLTRRLRIEDRPAMEWVADAVAELAAMEHVTHLQNASVWAYREHNLMMVTERSPDHDSLLERSWRVRAGRVICATGAIERLLVFPGNDRPGVMLASAAQAYVNRWAVRPGRRAVVFTNNNSAYAVAADMQAAGIEIAAIVDARPQVPPEALAQVAGIDVLGGHVVVRTRGRMSLRSIAISPLAGGATRSIACDLLAHSGGWNPAVHLFSQSRGSLRYDETLAAFVPDIPAQATASVGAAAGLMTLPEVLTSAAATGGDVPRAHEAAYAIAPLWRVQAAGKAFLDIQNDVTVADVQLALREGYDNIEHVKRYTTGGMGIDQGKTGNINIIGTVAQQKGLTLPEVGSTTFRSPYAPVSFGAVGGLRTGEVQFPYRHTPITEWNREQGAVMYEAGARWQRPGYFPQPGESFQETVNRECGAVREAVGVYDGSPLGTFELKGRDTGRFLDFLYTNKMANLKPGHGRYGLMLTDDGLILDDGVALRLDDYRWILSTSTGHADAVNQQMEKLLQTEFPDWQVMVTAVTSQWNNATVCGPRAREVMEALGTDINLDNAAFPFMTFRDGTVAGLPTRVVRVSFTGELSYEINVAPRHMRKLWDRVMAAGAPFGIQPVGSEANHVLRVEKGFLSLGHEVDGTVDPHDLGMGWIMSAKKSDYLGKRAVALRRAADKPRRELVGLLPDDPNAQIPEGAPLTPGGRKEATEGLVTACVWSGVNNRWVALALLVNGRTRQGETVHVRLRDEVIAARVTAPVFYDPGGQRLRS
ncbi:sarcosine oxidase subunit alpha family protein [Sedimentitalea nanhaiensis]|uniref:Sarcosine oxidase subunit alpha n=2 Tax=Sedimentitalea nanhaiensis TaxID=999627 RepID=A0A1I7DZ34_9RHOB|nr:sarcosine oxidase subunit alpha family protein [Sedimentitalea nanhaiensis]SFU16950.1 sarcosine oxidase subunit alpha [Sedimentitalea nanhaiensis]